MIRCALWLSVSLLASGCDNGQKSPVDTGLRPQIEIETDTNVIEVSHKDHFPLAQAEVRNVTEELLVNGTIVPDVSRTVPINALVGGRVLEVHARLGEAVTKGKLLLKIHSPELANAQAAFRKAQADELLAKRQYDRVRVLYEHGAVAQKDFEQAEDALAKARVDSDTNRIQVRLLNGDPQHLDPIILIRAPVSGVIVEQNVTVGAAAKSLDSTPNLFTIADMNRVWLLCDVYENNISQIAIGDTAKVRLNAFPDRIFQGRVGNIASVLDPNTRSAKVRVELDNSEGLLRSGMFATAIFVSQTSIARVVVPASAIFRLHDKDWVFVPEGEYTFRRTEIEAGPVDPDGTQQVLSGLQPGTQIARQALQLSDSAKAYTPSVPAPAKSN